MKLASAFDSLTPCHWPLAQLAARLTLNQKVPGSRPGRPATVSRGHRPKDRTVRYERTNRGSTPRARTKFSAGRPIAQDTALRTLKLGLESPLVDQVSRCRPTGEALDCRSRLDGFDSRTPRQVFRGCRLTAGSLVLTQRMRVQLSPALPWGCRLIGQDRCLSSSGCGFVSRRPYQVSGYKLWRRSTRLLIERAQFESVMAHQIVPR